MSDGALFAWFYASLVATLVALGASLFFAHKHRAEAHIAGVALFAVLLLVTLVFAEMLGTRFDFDATASKIHLGLAFTTAGFLIVPVSTGIMHYKGKMTRSTHVWTARVFLALAVATIGTGYWMLTTRIPQAPAAQAPAPG